MKNQLETNRIGWIDLAKGICMLLVVLGHCPDVAASFGLSAEFRCVSYVRMPLYFMLSGLFFKTYGSFLFFLKKKINHLLIPYVFFMTLQYVTPFTFDSVWFLYCLFIINLVGYALFYFSDTYLKKFISKEYVRTFVNITIVVLFVIVGFSVNHYSWSPKFLSDHVKWTESALIAFPFFIVGFYIKNYTCFLKMEKCAFRDLGIFILSVIIVVAIGWLCDFGYTSYFSKKFTIPIFCVYFAGIVGSLGLLSFARYLNHVPVISYIGRYSIIVLCTHKFIRELLIMCPPPYIRPEFVYPCVIYIMIILAEVPTIALCKKYLPYLFAQKELLH